MSTRSCASPSSPIAHITFCTLDEVLRPQILIMLSCLLVFAFIDALVQPPRLIDQHNLNAVADRKGELGLTRDQLLSRRVIFQRTLGEWTDQNLQELRVDTVRRPIG